MDTFGSEMPTMSIAAEYLLLLLLLLFRYDNTTTTATATATTKRKEKASEAQERVVVDRVASNTRQWMDGQIQKQRQRQQQQQKEKEKEKANQTQARKSCVCCRGVALCRVVSDATLVGDAIR